MKKERKILFEESTIVIPSQIYIEALCKIIENTMALDIPSNGEEQVPYFNQGGLC